MDVCVWRALSANAILSKRSVDGRRINADKNETAAARARILALSELVSLGALNYLGSSWNLCSRFIAELRKNGTDVVHGGART